MKNTPSRRGYSKFDQRIIRMVVEYRNDFLRHPEYAGPNFSWAIFPRMVADLAKAYNSGRYEKRAYSLAFREAKKLVSGTGG